MSGMRKLLQTVAAVVVFCSGISVSCNSLGGDSYGTCTRLEVHYFFNPVSAPSVHLATQWVLEAIENNYRPLLDSGKVTFVMHRTDDPLETDAVTQYRATAPALYLVRFEKDVRKVEEVKSLWAFLDPSLVDSNKKEQFIKLLKKKIDSAFEAKILTNTPIIAANEDLSSLDFRITFASTPLALDIILLPYDASGRLIVVEGLLSFTLWEKPAVFIEEKGAQLQSWEAIPINAANFAEGYGLTIRLVYQGFQPAPGAWAFLRLELLVDGVNYPVEKSLMIRPLRC